MAKTNAIDFFRQVKTEAKKITWPSRKETTLSTISVFVMVVILAIFLYCSDQVIAFVIQKIMGF